MWGLGSGYIQSRLATLITVITKHGMWIVSFAASISCGVEPSAK